MSACLLEETTEANLENIRKLRHTLAKTLPLTKLPAETQNNILLVCSEITTNIIRHADPPATSIGIELLKADNHWYFSVYDNGGVFLDFATIMSNKKDAIAVSHESHLNESGMGLALISTLFPEHHYECREQRKDNRNCFQIRCELVEVNLPKVAAIDDDRTTVSILERYLQQEFQVQTYTDPIAAVKEISRHPVDVVISDMMMPGLNGLEVRKRFAANPNTSNMPFIFLTGNEQTEADAVDLGIDDFLVKPVKKDKILAVIHRVLNRAKQIQSSLGDRLDNAITKALRVQLPSQLWRFNTATYIQSASSGGGDFIYNSPDKKLLLLGDIMGHGEQAKFFAHAYAGFIHGFIHATHNVAPSPDELLNSLSEAAETNDVLQSTLVTCICLAFNEYEDTLLCASAAHPPPFVVSQEHGCKPIKVEGPLAGLIPDQHYEPVNIQLYPGERLVIYTDGLLESANTPHGRKQLEEHVKKTLKNTLDLPIQHALDKVIETFYAYAASPLPDDVTVIMLELNKSNTKNHHNESQ
ncbi:SpoIIE family protein phosphatase [Zooshikella ganghwensis]|uniref:Response regulator n=1 Tax=Zooshikella ganghwensis TaxID=202772 RepID=A0A4P9VMM7_9GAMM|nr:SpoIIE family protein phosphatase [Zooshikella ganghwensis]RDH43370.1 response regulator [Zooshikella ganghwensis]